MFLAIQKLSTSCTWIIVWGCRLLFSSPVNEMYSTSFWIRIFIISKLIRILDDEHCTFIDSVSRAASAFRDQSHQIARERQCHRGTVSYFWLNTNFVFCEADFMLRYEQRKVVVLILIFLVFSSSCFVRKIWSLIFIT